ncbi:MAG: hypothetical protein LBD48_10745 [Treponema sp.]|nr:hypothetical protein [Treponema sp.]
MRKPKKDKIRGQEREKGRGSQGGSMWVKPDAFDKEEKLKETLTRYVQNMVFYKN